MGAQTTDPSAPGYDAAARPDEGPVHRVTLQAFWILRNEALSGMYTGCVERGFCSEAPAVGGDATFRDPTREQHPINGISWEGAQRYCAYLGGSLPTEAQWEYAARGTDGRAYPWGDEPRCGVMASDPKLASGGGERDVAVGCEGNGTTSFNELRGGSPFGLTGMAGSVWEWTADWYAPYTSGAATDPLGPSSGTARVQRGGGWASHGADELRSAGRGAMAPDAALPDLGLRCVRPVVGDTP